MRSDRRKSPYRISAGLLVLLIILAKSIFLLTSFYPYRPVIITYSILTISPAILLVAVSFLFNSRSKLVYLFFLDLLVSLIFFTDAVYYRAFDQIISVYMLFSKGVTEDLQSSVLSLIQWQDFLFLINLPFLYILFFHSNYFTEDSKELKLRTVQCLILLVLSLPLISYEFKNEVESASLCNPAIRPLTMSPLGAHMFDMYRFVYERTDVLDIKDVQNIEQWLAQNKQYQEVDSNYECLRGAIAGKNLIVIQFESLENVLIGYSINGQEITPNLNRLIGNSIYFNNIHEQTRDGNSSDAELLFNTSLYPLERGSVFLRFGDNDFPMALPRLLKETGYTTVAIHGDNKEFWNRNRVFDSFGFDKYISEEGFENNTRVGMGVLDEYLFVESLREINRLDSPYYLYIITVTSHMPFEAADIIKSIDIPTDEYTGKYLKCINYSDRVFGQFYEELDKSGYLDKSVIVIYGDHEGVHKYYPTSLPNNEKRIPYIVHIPGMDGIVINKVGGQIDMMPTLAYLLGMNEEQYSDRVMGRNLFNDNGGAALLGNGSIVGRADDENHLLGAPMVSDLILRGDFFKNEQNYSIDK